MDNDIKRINELIDKIFNGNACIFTYEHIAPETFAVDIAGLFNADVERDVLRNVLVGNEEALVKSIFIVLPEPIEDKELFIKLADYVNGTGMDFVLCCCKDKEGIYRSYELDPSNEYVECGGEALIYTENCVEVGAENILLLIDQLELGADKNILPSPTVMFIDQGEHYIDHLIGPDDEELM